MAQPIVTDATILFDLEFRGTQAFLIDMECGLRVPACFVERVIKIVERNYARTLRQVAETTETFTGTFCMMRYEDQKMVTLKK